MKLKRKCWLASHRYTSVCLACTSVVCLLMTVAEFILLFSTVTFHICIYFPVEMVFRLQRLFFWCCSASFSLSLSLSAPAPCSSTHLPCLFIRSPHSAEHQSSLLNQRFFPPFKGPQTPWFGLFEEGKKLAKNASIRRGGVNAQLIVMSVCLMKYTRWSLVPEAAFWRPLIDLIDWNTKRGVTHSKDELATRKAARYQRAIRNTSDVQNATF